MLREEGGWGAPTAMQRMGRASGALRCCTFDVSLTRARGADVPVCHGCLAAGGLVRWVRRGRVREPARPQGPPATPRSTTPQPKAPSIPLPFTPGHNHNPSPCPVVSGDGVNGPRIRPETSGTRGSGARARTRANALRQGAVATTPEPRVRLCTSRPQKVRGRTAQTLTPRQDRTPATVSTGANRKKAPYAMKIGSAVWK